MSISNCINFIHFKLGFKLKSDIPGQDAKHWFTFKLISYDFQLIEVFLCLGMFVVSDHSATTRKIYHLILFDTPKPFRMCITTSTYPEGDLSSQFLDLLNEKTTVKELCCRSQTYPYTLSLA